MRARLFRPIALLLALPIFCHATQPTPTATTALPETEAEWEAFLFEEDPFLDFSEPASSLWLTDTYTDIGYLWTSNALESVRMEEETLAVRAVLSTFAQRTFTDGGKLVLLAEAEAVHFATVSNLPEELFGFAVAKYERPLGSHWNLAFTATGIYLQNPYDAALAEDTARSLAVVRFTGVKSKVDLRRTYGHGLYTEFTLGVDRNLYNNPGQRIPGQETIGDSTEPWTALTLGWDYAKGASLSLAFSLHDRGYDTKPALSASGTLLTTPILHQYQHRLTARWKHAWGSKKQWSTTLRLSLRERTDNASGYYDYYYLATALGLQYRANPWTLRLEIGGNYTDYRIRTNGAGHLSHIWEPTASLELEYILSYNWTLLANANYLGYHSNRPSESYAETRTYLCVRRYF